MAKSIKIGNRDDIIHRMSEMLKLVKSCPRDGTFMFTFEIAQLDSEFMKKAGKFNEEMRQWEQAQSQKEFDKKMKELKTQDNL